MKTTGKVALGIGLGTLAVPLVWLVWGFYRGLRAERREQRTGRAR